MDVFGKLNEFLSNEDDSYKYDSLGSLDDSMLKESPNLKNIEGNTPDSGDKRKRSKRNRQSSSQNSSISNDEILDLTSGYPYHSSKSRRKLADNVAITHIEEEINLCDVISPSVSSNARGGRRGGRKAKAPRKVSYKKALQMLNAPLPDLNPSTHQQQSSTAISNQSSRSYDFAVDLTGDIELSDIHNKNPLFQNANKSKDNKKKNHKEQCSINLDDDLDFTSVNVKIKGELRKYRIKSDQRLYDLFKLIAEDENVPVCNVICFNGDKRINAEDSLDSIGHRVSSIYTCRLMEASSVTSNKKDMIELKFQSDKWKKPITLKVSRFESFLSHIQQLCKEVKFKPEQFTLKFDGDDIDTSKSPIALEFEGGEIIDCRIKG